MTELTNQSVATSFEQVLHVDTDGGGNGRTLVPVLDGDNGTTFAIQISTDTVCIDNPNTSSSTEGGVLRLQSDDNAVMASGHRLGVIEFAGAETTATAPQVITVGARIEAVTDALWSTTENGANLNFYTTDGDASQTQRMTILAGGNVGIGVAAPSAKIDIADSDMLALLGSSSGTTRANSASKIARVGVVHYTNAEEPVGFLYGQSTASKNQIGIGGGSATFNAATEINFWTAANQTTTTGTSRMHIDSAGNVGIGETSPASDLEIKGNLNTALSDSTSVVSDGATGTNRYVASTAHGLNVGDSVRLLDTGESAGGDYSIFTVATVTDADNFILDSNGDAAEDKGQAYSDSDLFGVRTGDDVSKLIIDSSGNVGIGTSAPAARLHIYNLGDALNNEVRIECDSAGGGATGNNYLTMKREDVDRYNQLQFYTETTLKWALGQTDSDTADCDGAEFFIGRNSAGATAALYINVDDNVGIGTAAPDAHLDVEDATVTMVADTDYIGIFSNHTITAGDSDTGNDIYGIKNVLNFNDNGESYGELTGMLVSVTSTETADEESDTITGIGVTAKITGTHSDVDNMYGINTLVDIESGTVDEIPYGSKTKLFMDGGAMGNDVVGAATDVDVDAGTITQKLIGNLIKVDTDVNPGTNVRGLYVLLYGNETANDSDFFIVNYDGEAGTIRHQVRMDGRVDAESTINASQALDYAEYFESKDGNAIAVGKTVKLDGDKIVACEEGDTPIGVIRPADTSAMIGGGQIFHWQDMFMKDDYGTKIKEDCTKIAWKEEIDKDEYTNRNQKVERDPYSKVKGSKAIEAVEAVEAQDAVYETVVVQEAVEEVLWSEEDELPEGVEAGDVKTEAQEEETEEQLVSEAVQAVEGVEGVAEVPDTYFRKHRYHSDRIPDGITAPDDATVKSGVRDKRNPDFDDSKEYKPREEREEWHIVGLLGQIPVTKGQPTGSWIKMKDVSDTVEMYFVK